MNHLNTQEEKVVLVTAGSRRIGAAIVTMLHDFGYKVAIHCRGALNEAHDLAAHLNEKRMGSALVMQRELTKPDVAGEMIATVVNWAGRLDVLVNNASVFLPSKEPVFESGVWQELFDVNVKVPYLLSLAAYPYLKKTQGLIINITDTHAQRPLKDYGVYCQTKAALEMQTKALARELAPEVRVNAVAPGAIAWPEGVNSLNAAKQKKIMDKTPLKKHGHPEYIAKAVWALVDNPFITGHILKVDGGRSL